MSWKCDLHSRRKFIFSAPIVIGATSLSPVSRLWEAIILTGDRPLIWNDPDAVLISYSWYGAGHMLRVTPEKIEKFTLSEYGSTPSSKDVHDRLRDLDPEFLYENCDMPCQPSQAWSIFSPWHVTPKGAFIARPFIEDIAGGIELKTYEGPRIIIFPHSPSASFREGETRHVPILRDFLDDMIDRHSLIEPFPRLSGLRSIAPFSKSRKDFFHFRDGNLYRFHLVGDES